MWPSRPQLEPTVIAGGPAPFGAGPPKVFPAAYPPRSVIP
nr:MAG TPA: hypothetical protein [Caudoviricetes sp.]